MIVFWKLEVEHFLEQGARLDAESNLNEYDRQSVTFIVFDQMVKYIEDEGLNAVEWIEGHLPVNMLDAKFIQQLPTWRQRYPFDNYGWDGDYDQSVGSNEDPHQASSDVPPVSLSFTLEEFLSNVAAAKAESHTLVPGPAWQLLLVKLTELGIKQVNFPAYVAGHVSQGDDDSLLASFWQLLNENGVIDMSTNIDGDMSTLESPTVGTSHVDHEDAVAFVDALPTVDISTIPRDDIRCPHCWADFDEDISGYSNEPKLTPCCRKRFGKDCLVESLEGTGPLCPLCRQDLLELGV